MLVLDAGALIAVDRFDRQMIVLIKREIAAGRPPKTHGGIVGQVWRNGAKQADLARFLAGIEVVALDQELGRSAGRLLGAAGESDVLDAAIVLLANDGDEIATSDPGDLAVLCEAAQVQVDLLVV